MKLIRKLFILLIVVLLPVQVMAFSFNIDQPGVHVSTKAGESKDGVIFVENTSDSSADFNVNVMDWTVNSKSKKMFYPAGSLMNSCSSWITVSPRNFSLKPGEKQKVKYIVSAPVDAEAGHYSVIFFETIAKSDTKAEVSLAGRIGSIIYHSVKGSEIVKAKIVKFKVKPLKNGLLLNYEMKNAGNVYTMIRPSLAVINDKGNVVKRARLSGFGIMPGKPSIRTDKVVFDLPKGKYRVLLTTEYGKYFGRDLYELKEVVVESSRRIKASSADVSDKISFEKISLVGTKEYAKFFVKITNSGADFQNIECNARILDKSGKEIKKVSLAINDSISPNSTKLFYKKVFVDLNQSMYKTIIELFVDGKKKEQVKYLSVK